MFKEFSLGCSSCRFRSYLKKKEISRNSYSLSLDVTRCITRLSVYKQSIGSALIEFKVYWKTNFSRNSHYEKTKPVILLVLQIIWLASELYEFLLKEISDQNCDYRTPWRVINTIFKVIISEAFCEYSFTYSNIRSTPLISKYYAIRRTSLLFNKS